MAAAITTGTAFAIIDNRELLAQPDTQSEVVARSESPTQSNTGRETPIKAIILSESEQKDIQSMLSTIGITGENYSSQIHNFQKKFNLETTGVLDDHALLVLIKQTTLHQTKMRFSGVS